MLGGTAADFVAPPTADSSAEIVSWVDRHVITDWTAEIAKRQKAIDGYLDDTDSVRAAKLRLPQRSDPSPGVDLVP